MGLALTGKLGRAWVSAWVVHGMVNGMVHGCVGGGDVVGDGVVMSCVYFYLKFSLISYLV